MKRINLSYILGLVLAVALATPNSAMGAPKKKAAPKAKIASTAKKSGARAPASKKAKSAPAKKSVQKVVAKKVAKNVKGKALAKAKPTPIRSTPAAAAPLPQERIPTGMAGLGLGSAAGSMNSNKAFEIRGQARTLSMMLILRNGKENVNFVKVRQDYAPEIAKTEF